MGLFNHGIMVLITCGLIFSASLSFARKSVYDPNCDCYVEDPSTPDIQEPADNPRPGQDPASPFVLKGTGLHSTTSKRDLSEAIAVTHSQPDGVTETRGFHYSTPKNFANRANKSVNLWFVFHGSGENSTRMHEFFEKIPHTSPTLLVYPQALRISSDNVVDTSTDGKTKWRVVRQPNQAAEKNSFRDVVFVDWLATKLLEHNPQLKRKKVFASGFSSGAGLTWMLLCYRSAPFQGFAIYSQQLGSFRESGGCGDGQLAQLGDTRTGYEKLTGMLPDKYGYQAGLALEGVPTKAVFYAHGTIDGNLLYEGNAVGCSEKGRCDSKEDPQYSMDPDGSLEDRDDISTVNWLTKRHQLSAQATLEKLIPDSDPGVDDKVTTHRYDYEYISDPGTTFERVHGEPIRWYEMTGVGHSLSALDQNDGGGFSTDYNVSIHTQKFFEVKAKMLKKK